jgi:hypothetical protein
VALLISVSIAASPVSAADIVVAPIDDHLFAISIIGNISDGDGNLFREKTKQIGQAVVFLKSPGGDLASGLSIGEQIRAKHFSTSVSFDNICASACALAWLSGVKRTISPRAKVGFHAAYTVDNGVASETAPGNAMVGAYLDRLGISYKGIYSLTSADPDDMHWINLKDEETTGISWEILDVGDGMRNSPSLSAAALILLTNLSAPSAYSAEPLSRAVQQGYDKGFHDCARALDRLVKFIHQDDSKYANFGQWSENNTNERIFSTVTSEPNSEGSGITSFTAQKNTSGKCDVSVSQIIYTEDSCIKVRDEDFKDWKYYGDLGGSAILEDPTSTNDNVILTSLQGNKCLIVKHLVGFDLTG